MMPINPHDHTGLVVRITQQYVARFGGQFDELLGVAWLALEAASRTFDPARGTRFSTLATKSIRKQLWEASMKDDGMRKTRKGYVRWVTTFDELGERGYMADVKDKPAQRELTDQERDLLRRAHSAACRVSNGRLVLAMIAKGMTQVEIAKSLGVTHQAVNHTLSCIRSKARMRP